MNLSIRSLAAHAVAGLALAAATSGAQVMAAELTLAHWMSPKHVMHTDLMEPWSKEVAAMSGGKLVVKIFPGGALGQGPVAQFQRAVDGIADITFGLSGFTSSQFRRTGVVELPAVTDNGTDGTNKLWNVLDKQLAQEWARVKVLALWVGEPQVVLTKDKAIRTLADFRGMKIRTPSKVQADTLEALGATPVPMPIDKVYNAISTGVLDGALTGASTLRSFKLGEVVKYVTTDLSLGRSPFFLVMNGKSYDQLPADQKSLIDKTTGRALSLKAAKAYDEESDEVIEATKKGGRQEVITFSPDEAKKTAAVLAKTRARLAAELEKEGVPAGAILSAMGVKD